MNITDFFTRVDTVTPDEVREATKKKQKDSFTLLDVREPREYEMGHLPGARLVPLSALLNSIDDLDREAEVITYCARGVRSRSAAALLKRNGFSNVKSMKGGIEAWNGIVATGEFEFGLNLLEGRETPEELVALAWGLEEGARNYYFITSGVVDDEKARDLLKSLEKAEERHKENLLKTFSVVTKADVNENIIKKSAPKGIMEGGVRVDDAIGWVRSQDNRLISVLEMAMHLEVNSLDLYIKMSRQIKLQDAEKIFRLLINEEKAHLERLGRLIEESIN